MKDGTKQYGNKTWQELQDSYVFESKRLNKQDREQAFKTNVRLNKWDLKKLK